MLEEGWKAGASLGGVYNLVLTPGCSLSIHHHLVPPHYYPLHYAMLEVKGHGVLQKHTGSHKNEL